MFALQTRNLSHIELARSVNISSLSKARTYRVGKAHISTEEKTRARIQGLSFSVLSLTENTHRDKSLAGFSIYACGVRYVLTHSICLLCKRGIYLISNWRRASIYRAWAAGVPRSEEWAFWGSQRSESISSQRSWHIDRKNRRNVGWYALHIINTKCCISSIRSIVYHQHKVLHIINTQYCISSTQSVAYHQLLDSRLARLFPTAP